MQCRLFIQLRQPFFGGGACFGGGFPNLSPIIGFVSGGCFPPGLIGFAGFGCFATISPIWLRVYVRVQSDRLEIWPRVLII